MILCGYEDLPEVRRKHKKEKIVYVSGSFDLPHLDHALFLQDAKNLGDVLVAAVASDDSLRQYKSIKDPNRPIFNQDIRIRTIDFYKPVDYTFINTNPSLSDLERIFGLLRPDFYAFGPDSSDMETREKYSKMFGVKKVVIPRHPNLSTTGIIEMIRKLHS